MVSQGSHFWVEQYPSYASTSCPPTSGVAQYTPVAPQSTHRSLYVPSPARATSRARPRERRDGSRRHSTRGSTDDPDGESEPPSGDAGRQCPAAGCSNELTGKQTACSPRCRQRLSRARRPEPTTKVLKPGPKMLALMAVWQGKAHRHVPADPHDPTYNAVAAAWGSKERWYDETPDRVRGKRDQPDVHCQHCGLKRRDGARCCLTAFLEKRKPIDPSRWQEVREGILDDLRDGLDRACRRSTPQRGRVLAFPPLPRSMSDEQVAELFGLPSWDELQVAA